MFLTGHTGFKGGWLSLWLQRLGAEVCGYALDPGTAPNLFEVAGVRSALQDVRGDIGDAVHLQEAMRTFAPEVVFHLAAQPLVRASYSDPVGTYKTNVLGTVNVLESIRHTRSVRAVVSVTTDKCYENKEWIWPYRETDPLGGYDPYSSSKACAEIVSAAYRQSYFPVAHLGRSHHVALATARAGNVIGGGDWSTDRLIPDLVRGFLSGEPVPIRYPDAIRPWQHVLEPLHGYLLLAEHLLSGDAKFATSYNFGPAEADARPVRWIADRMARTWSDGAAWQLEGGEKAHEAGYLKLDASRARADLGWVPLLRLNTALDLLVQWYRGWEQGHDMRALSLKQIEQYEALVTAEEAAS